MAYVSRALAGVTVKAGEVSDGVLLVVDAESGMDGDAADFGFDELVAEPGAMGSGLEVKRTAKLDVMRGYFREGHIAVFPVFFECAADFGLFHGVIFGFLMVSYSGVHRSLESLL